MAKPIRWIQNELPVYILGLPGALIIIAIKPLIHIKLGYIDCSRLGHFIGMSELYLCSKKLGHHDEFKALIFVKGKPINSVLYDLYNEKIHFRKFIKFVYEAFKKIIKNKNHIFQPYGADYDGIFEKVSPRISLDPNLIKLGQNWLESQGVDANKDIILFANRDTSHLDKIVPSRNWSYHNYRDNKIDKMILMAETMTERGYAAIRMGADVLSPLNSTNPNIIDYPSINRSDDLDIYLANRCKFFIATTSGIGDLGRMFRKPVACINAVPLSTLIRLKTQASDIWIPKLHKSIEKNRLMTFKEIIDISADQFYLTHQYEDAGIELIENSPEDIKALTLEVEDIISGNLKLRPNDEMLYNKFWEIVLGGKKWSGQSRIAISFLRQYPELLD